MEHYETFSCDRDRSPGMEVDKESIKLNSVRILDQAYSQEFYFYVVCKAWVYKERVWEWRGEEGRIWVWGHNFIPQNPHFFQF